MPEALSATEAAVKLRVPKTTVVGWLRSGIVQASTDERGRYRLSEDDLHTLRRVASLRASGASMESIRARFLEDGTLTVQQSRPSAPEGEGPTMALLRELLEAERQRSAELAARVEGLVAASAGWQARAELLDERVKLLEAPPSEPVALPPSEPAAARPWWRLW